MQLDSKCYHDRVFKVATLLLVRFLTVTVKTEQSKVVIEMFQIRTLHSLQTVTLKHDIIDMYVHRHVHERKLFEIQRLKIVILIQFVTI